MCGEWTGKKGWLIKLFTKFLWCPLEAGKGPNLSPANDPCLQSPRRRTPSYTDALLFSKEGGGQRLLIILMIIFIFFLGASAQNHPYTKEARLEGTFSGKGHSSPQEPQKVKRQCPPICDCGFHFTRSLCFASWLPRTNIRWEDEEGQILDKQASSPMPIIIPV